MDQSLLEDNRHIQTPLFLASYKMIFSAECFFMFVSEALITLLQVQWDVDSYYSTT